MNKRNWITALSLLLVARGAFGAACCSSSSAAPALISGDDRAQLSLSLGTSSIIGDAPASGSAVFRADNDSDHLQSLRLDGAILLSDRWQVGAGIPFLRHAVDRPGENGTTTSVGDIRANLAYEYLPEWGYSSWRPKGYLFTQLEIPNATSPFDGETPGDAGGFGRGFYTLALGTLLVKQGSRFDAYLLPEIHYALARTFVQQGESIHVQPGFGASAALGVGYSPGGGNLRLGVRVQPAYAEPMNETTGSTVNRTSYQLVWDSALELSYLVANEWSLTASYTDQTLLGPAVSTSLTRGFLVGIQHRWER